MRSLLLYALLVSLLAATPARAQFLFRKYIGTGPTGYELASQMIALRGGGYALAGQRNECPYLVKVNEQGDTLWTRSYCNVFTPALFYNPASNNSTIYCGSIAENRAGQLLLACGGSRVVGGPGGRRDSGGVLVLVDGTDGHVIWSREIQSPYADYYRAVCISNDGRDFIVASRLLGVPYVSKMDSTGAVRWFATPFGNDTANVDVEVLLPVPGGYIVGGQRSVRPYLRPVLKLDESGQEIWRKNTYFGTTSPVGTRAEAGNLLFSYGDLIKYNAQGDTLWRRFYTVRGSIVGIRSIALTPDSNYVALAERIYNGQTDWMFLKIAPSGQIIRDTIIYRGRGDEIAATALVDGQGNYVFYGWTLNGIVAPGGTPDLILAKYRGWRQVLAMAEEPLAAAPLTPYPNPTTDGVRLRADNAPLAGTLVLRDMLGREVRRTAVAGTAAHCSLADCPSGLYLLTYVPANGASPSTWRVVKQ